MKKGGSPPTGKRTDSTIRPDSLNRNRVGDSSFQTVDSFHIRYSKDTLDAPVEYEAADSGVLLVREKKFLLYGKTKTVYKTITLTAPRVEMDQATNILTAVNERDSLGNVIARADFRDNGQGFQSDTIRYNFKTQKGLTKNTYTKQDEMWVQGRVIKKVNNNITFARQVIMTTCDYDEPHFGFVANRGEFIAGKIAITGPIHPEFEGVPIPIYLPFGIFPLKSGRHSGLLPPQFTVNETYGLGLEGLGYYQVLNEYLDVTVRTNLYSYGTWMLNLIPTYRKRYKYDGQLNLSVQDTKLNFKGDPDYSHSRTFRIGWNHSVNPKATRGTVFGANVNIQSSKYNSYLPNDPQRNVQNQLQSSISYQKHWQGKPFDLSVNANHNQNTNSRDVFITLPDVGFSVQTLYPFQRKEMVGAAKWYEKIGIGYNGVARNQLSFNDSLKTPFKQLLDTMQWGAQHRFPLTMSLPPIGPLLINPFVSYEETWLTRRTGFKWVPTTKHVDTLYDKQGLFIDRQLSFGIGLNTAIYGTKIFKYKKGIQAIRHTIRPTINFSYKPNLSKKYYDVIQVDSFGNRDALPQFIAGRNMFSSYGYGKFGGITFAVDNSLEMKVKGKKDTANTTHKVKLIDGFGFSSGYNFLQDSLKLLPFNLYFRTTLFEKISITAQALWNPYTQDSNQRYINKFVWQGDRFSLGRLNGGSVSMSTSFQSKPRDPKKAPAQTATRQITDPNLLADQERLQEYMRRNPAEFVDFNIPWSVNLSFSLYFNPVYNPTTKNYKTQFTSSLNFNTSFSLTPQWNFNTNGYYDLNTMKLSMFTMSVSRDMHCWQMSVNVTPIGTFKSFNISINPKSSILQDLKVNRTRTFSNY